MNFKKWLEFVAEIKRITGNGVVELTLGICNGLQICIMWIDGEERYSYSHTISNTEIENMNNSVQPLILESIIIAVQKMKPNDRVEGRGRKEPEK